MEETLLSGLRQRIENQFSTDKLIATFTLEVENHLSKKNNRPIWNGRVGKSQALRQSEFYLETELRRQAKQNNIDIPIDEPIWCIFHFYFEKSRYYTKKGIKNKKLPDLSNLYELPQDSLTKAGIITDDRIIESHDLSRRLPSDKNKLVIFILKYDNEQFV